MSDPAKGTEETLLRALAQVPVDTLPAGAAECRTIDRAVPNGHRVQDPDTIACVGFARPDFWLEDGQRCRADGCRPSNGPAAAFSSKRIFLSAC